MPNCLAGFRGREAAPRAAVDFFIVHAAMLVALAVSVGYQTVLSQGADSYPMMTDSTLYYTEFFWPLSPLFPAIFLLNGFYTHSRGYMGRHKYWVIARGVGVAVLLFFAAQFLLYGGTKIWRSAALPFAVLAAAGVTGCRVLKTLFLRHYDVRPKAVTSPAMKPERVLVVGGAGYIGSMLVERLLEKGYKVRVLDSLLYGDEPLLGVWEHPDFELVQGDCRNIQDVVRAMRSVHSVIHLAAIVGDPACEQDHGTAIETNYAATRMLVEVAKGHGVSRFLFASSCSVYGARDVEMDESSEVIPVSLYGQTKVDSEAVLLSARSDTFHPTILRFATVFGLSHRPRFDLVVNLLAARAFQDGAITIFNGEQWRPFLHVKDVVEAVARVLEAPARLVCGEVFNVGDPRLNCRLRDIGEVIRRAFPATLVEHKESTDRRNYRVSFAKIEKKLGFRARYNLQDGVEELKRAFEQRVITDCTGLRYHNQRCLSATGSPGHKDELDGLVMAAFAAPRDGRGDTAGAGRAPEVATLGLRVRHAISRGPLE